MADEIALIVGAGSGLSASLARRCAGEGMRVALAARNADKLADLARETGARAYAADAAKPESIAALFAALDRDLGTPDLVVYNPSRRVRGGILELDPAEVEAALKVTGFGGFLVAQQAARRMLPRGSGTILFTGASASVKGYAKSAPFAMGKFALRGLAQSLARELAPQGIHVGHVVIDGGIASSRNLSAEERAGDRFLDPDAIAEAYLQLHRQKRSAWAWEIELRPWTEPF
jgi:NAD(P)-dependent dehydrogenase (short-subunit alcohol dehydrogenase family)